MDLTVLKLLGMTSEEVDFKIPLAPFFKGGNGR
jgi:hypothetical protein